MSMWKDLVTAQNCGVPNSAAGFASNLQHMNQQIGDAKQFDPQQQQQHMSGGPVNMNDMLQQHMPAHSMHGDVDAFLSSFNQNKHQQQHMMQHHRQTQPNMRQQQRQPINPDMMAAEFERMQLQMRQQPHQDNNLANQFEQVYNQQPMHGQQRHWAAEFDQQRLQHHKPQQHTSHTAQPRHYNQHFDQYQQQRMMHQPFPTSMPYMPQQTYNQPMMPPQHVMQQPQAAEDLYGDSENKTAEKPAEPAAQQQDGDWANEYSGDKEMSAAGLGGMDADMMQKLVNSDNPKWANSKFLKFINKISKGEIEFKDNQAIDKNPTADGGWAAEFDTTTRSKNWDAEFMASQGQNVTEQIPEISTDDWARQFAGDGEAVEDGEEADPLDWDDDTMNAWAKEYSKDIAQEWNMKNWMGEFQDQAKQANATIDYSDPTYVFESTTAGQPVPDSYEKGIALLQAGKLKEAIEMFETTVANQPDHADAWCYLGQAQAENESENNAIAALLKAVSIDPYNLTALMMLGVSYTNDLEEHRALNYLKTWLLNNPDYQHPSIQQHKHNIQQYEQMYGSSSQSQQSNGPIVDVTLHDEVTRMFLAALQVNKQDSDLHTVLGVLYHITGDFDKAIDEFKFAIQLKPNDAQLWNKLGATQANSSRSNDAVHAYRKALELRPSYVRALANLAISYANQGMHEDAVRQYLITLKHNPHADHIWSYLRISLSHLGKDNLVDLSHQKNVEAFRPYYQF